MVLHRSLSDRKSPKVYKTLLSIPADLNNTVVWMVSTSPFISNASSLFTFLWGLYRAYQLQLVSRSPSCFHCFFSSLARSRCLSLFSLSFNFTPLSAETLLLLLLLLYFLRIFLLPPLTSSFSLEVYVAVSFLMSTGNYPRRFWYRFRISILPQISSSTSHLSGSWGFSQVFPSQLISLSPSRSTVFSAR